MNVINFLAPQNIPGLELTLSTTVSDQFQEYKCHEPVFKAKSTLTFSRGSVSAESSARRKKLAKKQANGQLVHQLTENLLLCSQELESCYKMNERYRWKKLRSKFFREIGAQQDVFSIVLGKKKRVLLKLSMALGLRIKAKQYKIDRELRKLFAVASAMNSIGIEVKEGEPSNWLIGSRTKSVKHLTLTLFDKLMSTDLLSPEFSTFVSWGDVKIESHHFEKVKHKFQACALALEMPPTMEQPDQLEEEYDFLEDLDEIMDKVNLA